MQEVQGAPVGVQVPGTLLVQVGARAQGAQEAEREARRPESAAAQGAGGDVLPPAGELPPPLPPLPSNERGAPRAACATPLRERVEPLLQGQRRGQVEARGLPEGRVQAGHALQQSYARPAGAGQVPSSAGRQASSLVPGEAEAAPSRQEPGVA